MSEESVVSPAAPTPPEVADADAPAKQRRRIPETAALVVVLLGLVVFFSITSDFFLSSENFINILQNVAVIGIIACPATLLLIAGQVDLSVGSAAGFVGMAVAVAATATDAATTPFGMGLSVGGALLIGVAAAVVIGILNGGAVTWIGLNSIITTLGTLAILRGVTKVIGDGQTIRMNEFAGLGISRPLFNIPLPVYIFVAVAILFWFILRYTVFGRRMYAIGASPVAARLAGIPTRRVIFIAFMLSALFTGLAGLIRLSQLGAASVNAGVGFELSALTAVILGGASLSGGRGSIQGTVLAVLVVGVLANGLIQLRVPSFWIEVAQGALLLGAVTFDQIRIRISGEETAT